MTPICPHCRNRGYKIVQVDGYAVADGYCACPLGAKLFFAHWKQKMLDAHIYEEYHPLELQHLVPQEYPEHVRFVKHIAWYIQNMESHITTGKSVLICGGTGTGKTLAGMLILKEALRHKKTAYYITWPEMLNAFIQDFDDEKKSQRDKVKESAFLAIDQLGADSIKKESKHPVTTLEEILRYRFTRLKPTILITELSYTEVMLRFNIVEDFKDKLDVLEVRGKNWRSFRGTKKAKEGDANGN